MFSGSELSSLRKLDVNKVRRVLEGKAMMQIVDMDIELQGQKVSDNCKDTYTA